MPVTQAAIDAYTEPLIGHGLPSSSLPELVGAESITILHFLRHLGCLYCKDSVSQLKAFVDSVGRFPTIFFVHPSTLKAGDAFFAQYYPGAPHISDESLKLYNLFDIRRLNPVQFANPLQVAKGALAFLRGHRQVEVLGNEWVLTGTFLFYNGQLRWQHRGQYAGDNPDWRKLAVATA
ncbi:MAG: hypothetical protein SFY70_00405 [Bacteroidia bacterium]|nr:hypothetical protein [Bacteroidia bacterium]